MRNNELLCVILYSATSLDLISSKSFLVESLEFSTYIIISSATNNNFTSFFSYLVAFYFFVLLISSARTSSLC